MEHSYKHLYHINFCNLISRGIQSQIEAASLLGWPPSLEQGHSIWTPVFVVSILFLSLFLFSQFGVTPLPPCSCHAGCDKSESAYEINAYISTCIAALFIIAKVWSNLDVHLDEWTKNIWLSHWCQWNFWKHQVSHRASPRAIMLLRFPNMDFSFILYDKNSICAKFLSDKKILRNQNAVYRC